MKARHWHSAQLSTTIVLLALLFGISIHLFSSHATVKASQHPINKVLQHLIIKTSQHSTSVVIMPLGDSITFGVGSPSRSSYRLALWQRLTGAGINVSFVGSMRSGSKLLPDPENEGHSGWRIRQISEHIVNWLQAARPDYVLLHIGTNDILHHDDPMHAPERLKLLLDQITITLPGVTVLVAQITSLAPQFEPQVQAYNKAIPDMVRQEVAAGKHMQYVDIHDYVPLVDIPDMVHPDDAGYALMAQAWYLALYPLLSSH